MNMNRHTKGLRKWWTLAILVLTISACATAQQLANPGSQTNADQTAPAPALVADAATAPGTAEPAPAPAAPSGSSSGNFAGFYFGVHGGYGTGNRNTFVNPLPSAATFVNLLPQTLHPKDDGLIGGGQVGYNWTLNQQLVIGFEADLSISGMNGTKTLTPITQNNGTPFPGTGFVTAHQRIGWYGTFRPRVGTIVGRYMVYGTGGLAWASVQRSANTDFRPVGTEQYPAAINDTKPGWVAGGGVEMAINHHWGLGFEYLRIDLGRPSVTANPVPPLPPFGITYSWRTTANTFNGVLNFRF